MAATGEIKKTSVNLDEDLWRRARMRAIEEDTTVSELVERTLREYLKNGKK